MIKIGEPPRSNLLNDSLDDLLGDVGAVRTEPVQIPGRDVEYHAPNYAEPCSKCRGTGRTRWGACFRCKGQGKRTFETSPESRAASIQRKIDREQDLLKAFEEAHSAVHAWLKTNADHNGFAGSLWSSLHRFGSLTDGQRGAVERIIARNAEQTAEVAKRAEQAPTVDTAGIDRLKAAFDHAIAFTRAKGKGRSLRNPKITLGGVTISPAKEGSANFGALYVKERGEYLGKIQNGKFFGRNCPVPTAQRVLAFIADPESAAKAYGIETGTCCICNATLTNKASIKAGIGPICAEKFGWFAGESEGDEENGE